MKILIAGSDPVPREVVRRVLSDFTDAIVEAEDGIEALDLLQREDPDLLVTDLEMPGIDGEALIRAVRSDDETRAMPVICTSPCRDRSQIERLIALRIDEYILQPFAPRDAHQRFKRVLERAANWRAQRTASNAPPVLLLIDPDPNFRAFFREAVGESAPVLDAATSAVGLRLYRDAEEKPTDVLLAQGLPVLGEQQVAQLITRMAKEGGGGGRPPRFWLVSDAPVERAERAADLSGVVRRTFVPDAFAEELARTVLPRNSAAQALRTHVAREGRNWLASATRQALGSILHIDATAVEPEASAPATGARARVILAGQDVLVSLQVSCGPDGAQGLATKSPKDLGDSVTSARLVEQLSTGLAARVTAVLQERGFELRASDATVDERSASTGEGEESNRALDAEVTFETATGERFQVALVVSEPASDASA
jgi:CheY-like chemotaxis protein